MTAIAHLIGGPKDGDKFAIEKATTSLEVMVINNSGEPLTAGKYIEPEVVTYFRHKWPSKRSEDGTEEEWDYVYVTPGRK